MLGGFTVGDGARVGANSVLLQPVPAGATAVGIPARIVIKDRDAQREQVAAKMGFSAYGVTQGDDPVAQAMKGLIDNAAGHEHQIALLWQAIEKLSAARTRAAGVDCVPQDAQTTETFDADGLEPAGQVARSGRAGRHWPVLGRQAAHTVGIGLDVGTADQVDAVGHRGEDAGHRRLGLGQALERFGDRLRLARQVDDQRSPRITATWRDRIAVGTKRSDDLPHLLAEARHHLVGHRQRGLGRDVARRRARCRRW